MSPSSARWGPILSVMTLFMLYLPQAGDPVLLHPARCRCGCLLAIYILVPLLSRFNGSGSPGIDLAMVLAGAGFAYAYKQFDLRWSRLTSGRTFRPRLRIFSSVGYDQGALEGQEPVADLDSVGGGGPVALGLGPARGAARRPARRDPRQDRPRGQPGRPDRGGAAGPPGGQPPRPDPAERPNLMPDSHRPATESARQYPPTCRSSSSSTACWPWRPSRRCSTRRSSRRASPARWPIPTGCATGSPSSTATTQPVGQAAVTREWSDWRNGMDLVVPERLRRRRPFRGRGVFRALYHHIRDEARSLPDVIGLRLYVEDSNAPGPQDVSGPRHEARGLFGLRGTVDRRPIVGHRQDTTTVSPGHPGSPSSPWRGSGWNAGHDEHPRSGFPTRTGPRASMRFSSVF